MSVVIQTDALTKQFSGNRGVQQVSIQVQAGQIFGFLGPNGAGKSTFIKMLIGLLRPTSGEAHVLGFPLGAIGARRRIGYLPELFRYQGWLTGEEVLRFHGRLSQLDGPTIRRRIPELVREVGLVGREHERVKGYSKGMQQRLGLACALIAEPDLLFLDEPASALDPGGRHEMRQLLSRLGDLGMTIFLNTHVLEDVEEICSNVALLTNGHIRAQGAVQDILHPEPIWTFLIGGWENSLQQALQERISHFCTSIHVTETKELGVVQLDAKLMDAEQAAFVNLQLVNLGVSVYSISPRRNRLESWFLKLTEEAEK